jgi:hypothetical protein
MMRRIKLIVAAAMFAAASAASAIVLPDAKYIAVAFGGTVPQTIKGPGTVYSSGSGVSGSASISGYQRVSAEGSAFFDGTEAVDQAYATYYFGVLGPSAVDVPLILTGSASVSAHGCKPFNGCSSAEVNEEAGRNDGPIAAFGSGSCFEGSPNCRAYSFIQSLHLISSTATTTGDVGYTKLAISVIGYHGSASGFIDPFITIDPSFANASQYSVVFSSGTGNPVAAAVPEPAEWAMLLIGFGFAGGALRSRRSTATVLA